MPEAILEIKDLSVRVDNRPILHDVNLTVNKGETHVLFGPNGNGKTTLLMTSMGAPRYKVTGGKIMFKGHLECRGLILKGEGQIHAIQELKGNLAGIDLSHEAAVGKIAEEEVEYLMARGLSRNEATSTIVRGFLHVDIEGLPPMLAQEMQRAVEMSEKDLM
jgi:ABC-type cobalamin/Fe3+-siderophores transport system ATPase subunit